MVRPRSRRGKDDKHAIVGESNGLRQVTDKSPIRRYLRAGTTGSTNGFLSPIQQAQAQQNNGVTAKNGVLHDGISTNGLATTNGHTELKLFDDLNGSSALTTAAAAAAYTGAGNGSMMTVHSSPSSTNNKEKKPTTPHKILCPSPDRTNGVQVPPISVRLGLCCDDTNHTKEHLQQQQQSQRLPSSCEVTTTKNHATTATSKKTANAAAAGTHKNGKITDYYNIRRSARKTKKEVQHEILMNYEKCVLNRIEDGLEIRIFPGKGRGIVATRHFARGDFVVEYSGDLISPTAAKNREAQYADDDNAGCYMYYFKHSDQQYCIDATAETDRLGRLINHSRNGNLTTKIITILDKPHLVLIAKTDIRPGEELMYDYGDRSKESLIHHPWLAY